MFLYQPYNSTNIKLSQLTTWLTITCMARNGSILDIHINPPLHANVNKSAKNVSQVLACFVNIYEYLPDELPLWLSSSSHVWPPIFISGKFIEYVYLVLIMSDLSVHLSVRGVALIFRLACFYHGHSSSSLVCQAIDIF